MRLFTRFFAIVFLVSVTWICGPTVDAATAAEPTKPGFAFPTENITIEVWWHEYGPFTAYVKELIEAYKKLHPNVTINATVASSTDMNQKLTVALAAGTGPDIMDADASYYVAYYTKGILEPANLDVFGVKNVPGTRRPLRVRRSRVRYVRREDLHPAVSGQLDESLHQQQIVRCRGSRSQERRAQDLEGPHGFGPQTEKGRRQADRPEGIRVSLSQPALAIAGPAADDRTVRRQDPERRWQDGIPQQPRDDRRR